MNGNADRTGAAAEWRVMLVLAAVMLTGSSQALGQNGAVGVAYPAKGITIDGSLSDWLKDTQTYPIARVEFGDKPTGENDLKAGYRMAFSPSERALYVGVEVKDDSIVLDGPGEPRWDAQDGCELFVNSWALGIGGVSPMVQYARYGNQNRIVGPPEVTEKSVKVAVTRTESSIIYEWRIEIAESLDPDRTIGFDISVADKDKDGSFSWAAWGSGTQKIDTPNRCGEFVLARPDTKFGEISGRVTWKDPSESAVPSRVWIQSTQNQIFNRMAIVDSTGAYKAALIPPGTYTIRPIDSVEVRVKEDAHVLADVETGGKTAEAPLLRISPIPWPGLIGEEGILRSRGTLDPEEIDRVAKAYLDYYKIPGMSLAIIKDSKIAYQKGYGVKNFKSKEPVTATTVFEAASMTKPVFAYLVLRLVDRGILDLDTPLYKYLPYEDIAHDDRYKLITARMALTHRTGFPNWRTGKLEIKFVPGTQVSYSGEGFVYLGKVVEKLTGKKLAELFRDEVFTPLDVKNASLVWNDEVARETATGHNGIRPLPKGKPTEPNTAASLHIDAGNYAKFLTSVLKGKELSDALGKEMLRPQIKSPEKEVHSWGLGIAIGETPVGTHHGHGGRNTGFTSMSLMYKDQGIGYVVLVNNDDAPKMDDVLNAYLITGKAGLKLDKPVSHKQAKVDPRLYDAYVGKYAIGHETTVSVFREGDHLKAQPENEGSFEIFPESETIFFVSPSSDVTITFVKASDGKVAHAVLNDHGRTQKLTRVAVEKKPEATK